MPSFTTVLIPSQDLATSRDLYRTLLGVDPSVDSEYYVGFDVDGQHIGLVPGSAAVTPHLHVDDLDAALASVTAAGGSVSEAPRQVGGGRTVAVFTDASGARIGLIHDQT